MIIWSSINCPIVICLPTVCYFSREKPLVKPTAPGSYFSYICFAIYFSFTFLFRSIKLKNTKISCYIFIYLRSIISIYYNLPHVRLPISGAVTRKGLITLFNTLGCEVLLFVCRCCLRCVAWFSYWFNNLGFFTEGNTYLRCATSSLPLWGNTDVVLADRSFSGATVRERSKGISGVVVGEDLQHIPGS